MWSIKEATVEEIVINRRIMVGKEDGESIAIEPADCFGISYTLLYPHPVGLQQYTYIHSGPQSFRDEIAPARTFGFLRDMKQLATMGLASGGRLDNCVLIDDEKVVNTALRFPDEFARHKILDIMGDAYLLGRPLRGMITARMTGHSDNIALLREIQQDDGAGLRPAAWVYEVRLPVRRFADVELTLARDQTESSAPGEDQRRRTLMFAPQFQRRLFRRSAGSDNCQPPPGTAGAGRDGPSARWRGIRPARASCAAGRRYACPRKVLTLTKYLCAGCTASSGSSSSPAASTVAAAICTSGVGGSGAPFTPKPYSSKRFRSPHTSVEPSTATPISRPSALAAPTKHFFAARVHPVLPTTWMR